MDFSKQYFGKPLQDLTIGDITHFFTEENEESATIEFKAFASEHGNTQTKLNGVIRGICAFLNSEGGIVVWGAPVGQQVEGKKEDVFQGDLSPVNELIEKDRLISKVSDSITPLPVGVNVQILEHRDDYIYIFEVQKSDYSPHQFKNTYYARLDGQTKTAPHYLVEALFKRIKYPRLEGYIKFDKLSHDGNYYYLDISTYIFNFSELQNEEDVSYRIICGEGIFVNSNRDLSGVYSSGGHQFTHKGDIDVLHFGNPDVYQDRLQFNPNQVLARGNTITIVMTFGGKKSPLKSSRYTLNWGITDTANYLISDIEENKLFSELQDELGSSRESILQDLLNR